MMPPSEGRFEELLAHVRAGNAEAMANLGSLNARGEGVPQDFAQARTWWKRAAEAGQAGG